MEKPAFENVPLFAFATAMEFSAVFPKASAEYPDAVNKLIPIDEFPGGAYACVLDVGALDFSVGLTSILLECRQTNIAISAVVNVGICGAYPNRCLNLLDVVRVDEDLLGDYGCEEQDGSFSSWAKARHAASPKQAPESIRNIVSCLKSVRGATVNCCTGTECTSILRSQKLDCDVESMEGIACFAVCEKFQIPAFQIRAVSNFATSRDKSQWKSREALEKLRATILA